LDKGRIIGALTIVLGLTASWKIVTLSSSLHAVGVNDLLLVQVVISVFAFAGGVALITAKIAGYFLALVAWVAELISGTNASMGEETSSYFISVSAVVSVIVVGVLIYGIAQRLLRKNT